jgi:hypothetical protein
MSVFCADFVGFSADQDSIGTPEGGIGKAQKRSVYSRWTPFFWTAVRVGKPRVDGERR